MSKSRQTPRMSRIRWLSGNRGKYAMSKAQYLCAVSAGVLAAATLATAAQAQSRAASGADKAKDTEVGEVVVTGSFIAGTPEDAAVPVEAVTLEELRNQGSPSNLDLVKT